MLKITFIFFSVLTSCCIALQAAELQKFENCKLVATAWSDGDSFLVQFSDDETYVIRLYGADTFETEISTSTMARRLRAQRRYFGISSYGNSAQNSVALAKEIGNLAKKAVERLLAEPFTAYTAFADGRGSSNKKRYYGFIETANGKDLATELVSLGLARAYGVYRSTPDGQHRDEYIERLKDTEFVAACEGLGIWAFTNWEALPEERHAQRLDEAEEALAMGQVPFSGVVNINTADSANLSQIPGIGPVIAERIIAKRPFKNKEDLSRVSGIGLKKYESIVDFIKH